MRSRNTGDFQQSRWHELSAKGCRPAAGCCGQHSTKNPAYPDTLYVDELIGPETVNTLPPETVKAFIDHGHAAETLTRDLEGARRQIRRLAELGIDFDAVTRRLQEEGVAAFAKPFQALLDSIEAKTQTAGLRGYGAMTLQDEFKQRPPSSPPGSSNRGWWWTPARHTTQFALQRLGERIRSGELRDIVGIPARWHR